MLTVTEPQVWTMIGVFTALFLGTLTLISTLFVRVVRSEVGRIEGKFDGHFDAMNTRIDALDRDVQALVKHTFGIDRG